MPGWLLGPQAFADFIAAGENEVVAWASALADPVYVSETTWAFVRSQALRMPDVRRRTNYLRHLDSVVPAEFGARLLKLDRSHLTAWSEVRLSTLADGNALPVAESFDAAVCIVETLGYVTDVAGFDEVTGQPTHNPWNT